MNEEHSNLDVAITDLRQKIGANFKLVPVVVVSEVNQFGLVNRALEVLASHIELGSKYFELCSFIRKNQLPPKPTRELLAQCGFNKVRISEILRVSNVPDDMWQPYRARAMSFAKVLELARLPGVATDEQLKGFIDVSTVTEAEPQAELPNIDVSTVTEAEPQAETGETPKSGEEGEGAAESSKPEKTEDEKRKEKASRAAIVLLGSAEFFNWKQEVFRNGSEWEVVVRKVKKQTNKQKATDEK